MPGLLKKDAKCPKCGEPLEAMVRTSNSAEVVGEYFHEKGSPKARRKRRCLMRLTHEQEEKISREIHVAA